METEAWIGASVDYSQLCCEYLSLKYRKQSKTFKKIKLSTFYASTFKVQSEEKAYASFKMIIGSIL